MYGADAPHTVEYHIYRGVATDSAARCVVDSKREARGSRELELALAPAAACMRARLLGCYSMGRFPTYSMGGGSIQMRS